MRGSGVGRITGCWSGLLCLTGDNLPAVRCRLAACVTMASP